MEGEKPRGRGGVGMVVKGRGGPGCPLGSCWVSGRYGGRCHSEREPSRAGVGRCDSGHCNIEELPNEELNPAGGLGRKETRAWLPGPGRGLEEAGEGTLRYVSAQARLRTRLNTAAGRAPASLKAPIPTVQMGRLKPGEEGKTPRSGVTDPGLHQFTGFGPKIIFPDTGLFLARRQQCSKWIRSLQFCSRSRVFGVFLFFYFKMCFKIYILASWFLSEVFNFCKLIRKQHF